MISPNVGNGSSLRDMALVDEAGALVDRTSAWYGGLTMNHLRWYVAETLPKLEETAQAHLSRQGFANFLPRMRKLRRHARRNSIVLAPVFPGYIFVHFDPDRDPWRSINGTRGVRRLVGSNPLRPQPVPQAVMRALQARCEPSTLVWRPEEFRPGDAVRFCSGPFADQLARVTSLEPNDRVTLLLEILGGARRIIAPADALVSA